MIPQFGKRIVSSMPSASRCARRAAGSKNARGIAS
jgi:hypothetical protein